MEPRSRQREKYIILGSVILLKIMLMGLFSSDHQDKLFRPFVEVFLSGKNPYEYYYANNLPSSFPYLPLMLLIESAGGLLLRLVPTGSIFLQNLLFKLPLLAFDMAGFVILRKMGVRFKYAVAFYCCLPVLLYSTYMHGQLDIIPTVLLLASLYYLTNWGKQNNLLRFSLLLGLALSTKFHILAALPILLLYVAAKKGAAAAAKSLSLVILIVAAFVLPFMGEGIVQNVFLTRDQNVLAYVFLDYRTTRFLIPFAALMAIYFRAYELSYFNKELLFSLLGLLFSVFLICIPPMPAWYIWIIPFIALYFGYVENSKHKVMFIYACFNLAYLTYFIPLHSTGYVDLFFLGRSLQWLNAGYPDLKYFVFTVMVSLLGMVVYNIYEFGIASNGLYRRRNVPFTIGVAGDSGSGKSKLLEKIRHLFGTGRDILFIEGDGDHRWARNDGSWKSYTALDPKANYLYRQANDIRTLRRGNPVQRTDYDHSRGTFTEARRIRPQKYIVLCGLHSLYLPQLRRELDLKIYMDTEETLRKFWKIERDCGERGYSVERALDAISRRRPDAEKYVYPQKQYADLSIQYFDRTLLDCADMSHKVELSVRLSMNINMDIEEIVSAFQYYGVHPVHSLSRDFDSQEVVFDGADLRNPVDYEAIARRTIPQYDDLFTYRPQWGEDVEGVIQLFLLVFISWKMKEGSSFKGAES